MREVQALNGNRTIIGRPTGRCIDVGGRQGRHPFPARAVPCDHHQLDGLAGGLEQRDSLAVVTDVAAPHRRCHAPGLPAEGGDLPDGSLARPSRRRVVDQRARIRGPSRVLVIGRRPASPAAARHRRAGGSESGAARRPAPQRRPSSRRATRQETPSCPRSR